MINNRKRTTRQQKAMKRFRFVLLILSVLIVVSFIISMNTGYIKLTPVEVFKTLFGYGTNQQSLILFEFRLPRIVIAILVGMALAVSGCILQSISGNPLADPGILGINAGAGLAVILFISFLKRRAKVRIFP